MPMLLLFFASLMCGALLFTPNARCDEVPAQPDSAVKADAPALQTAPAPDSAASEKPESAVPASAQNDRAGTLITIQTAPANPFDYNAGELGPYIPTAQTVQITIRVKGILKMADGRAQAILQIENDDNSYFVGKGDVIPIPNLKESPHQQNPKELYLQVTDITENMVEIVQQSRPDKVMIIR